MADEQMAEEIPKARTGLSSGPSLTCPLLRTVRPNHCTQASSAALSSVRVPTWSACQAVICHLSSATCHLSSAVLHQESKGRLAPPRIRPRVAVHPDRK